MVSGSMGTSSLPVEAYTCAVVVAVCCMGSCTVRELNAAEEHVTT